MIRLLASLELGLLLVALGPAVGATQSTGSAGYDSEGRLICVRRAESGTTRTTTYAYDDAGNRSTVATVSGGSCASSTGTPPTTPGYLSVTDPVVTVSSSAVNNQPLANLGSASDSGSLALVAARVEPAPNPCGSVAFTASQLTYTAPSVGSLRTCRVAYTLRHANGGQRAGVVTYTVNP